MLVLICAEVIQRHRPNHNDVKQSLARCTSRSFAGNSKLVLESSNTLIRIRWCAIKYSWLLHFSPSAGGVRSRHCHCMYVLVVCRAIIYEVDPLFTTTNPNNLFMSQFIAEERVQIIIIMIVGSWGRRIVHESPNSIKLLPRDVQ